MNWKGWDKKYVSMKVRTGKEYSGKVVDVDVSFGELIWITIKDDVGKENTFVNTEITDIKEIKK